MEYESNPSNGFDGGTDDDAMMINLRLIQAVNISK